MQHSQRNETISFIRICEQHALWPSEPINVIPQALSTSTTARLLLLLRDVYITQCQLVKKSCGRPRHRSAVETVALTHSPETLGLLSELLSVSRKRCSQGANCHNNLAALELLKSQGRNHEFVTPVPKLHLTESWYFHNHLSEILQSYLSDRKASVRLLPAHFYKVLGDFFNANVTHDFDLTASTED